MVFLDEIDAVGAKRTSSEIHPYANQTINQLLTEMDGYVWVCHISGGNGMLLKMFIEYSEGTGSYHLTEMICILYTVIPVLFMFRNFL